MIYNHYIPNADGSYERKQVGACPAPKPPAAGKPDSCVSGEKKPSVRQDSIPELGDLLVLCILLLVLVDSKDGDWLSALVTLSAFLLMQ